MKKQIIKLISFICAFTIIFSCVPLTAFAAEDKFVELNVKGIDEKGKEWNEKEVFYVHNNALYAPIEMFDKYTLYSYDKSNTAFVRINQEFKKATSAVKLDFANTSVTVKYSALYTKDYDMEMCKYGDTYFLPLHQTAAYLKANVEYVDDKSLSIINSGVSVCDAMYGFDVQSTMLNADRLAHDLYSGSDFRMVSNIAFGYFVETVWTRKVSNVVVSVGDMERSYEYLCKAVTNTDVYEETMNNSSFLSDVLSLTNKAYGKSDGNVEKLSLGFTKAGKFLYESHLNERFEEELPKKYKKYFTDGKIKVKQFEELSDEIKKIADFIELVDYINDYYRMNDANRNALKYVSHKSGKGSTGTTIRRVDMIFGDDDFAFSLTTQLIKKMIESKADLFKDGLTSKVAPGMWAMNGAEIFYNVLKKTNFAVPSSAGYDVLIIADIISYISNIVDDTVGNEEFSTPEISENYRLVNVLNILLEIEGYKMGNETIKSEGKKGGNYDKHIKSLEKRLSVFYSATDSYGYDDFESIEKLVDTNKKQVDKFKTDGMPSAKYAPKEESKSTILTPTDKDFTELRELVNCIYHGERNYNKEKIDTVYSDIFDGEVGCSLIYSHLFLGENYDSYDWIDYNDTPDPLKKFSSYEKAYYKTPADKIDWIVKNVFNRSPEKLNKDNIYYYNGYYYTEALVGIGGGYETWEIQSKTQQSDGKYSVQLRLHDNMDDVYTNDYITVTATLKETDGIRHWSLYTIKNGKPTAEAPEASNDITKTPEFIRANKYHRTVSSGANHTVAVRNDGTVIATSITGDISDYLDRGQCNVSGWRDIVAVSAGLEHTVGLKKDGTVVAVGADVNGRCDVSNWKDIVAIAAGGYHTVGLKKDGTVIAVGNNFQKECEVSGWKDIVAVAANEFYTIGLKKDGTVVATGSNSAGQCNVSGWKNIVEISVDGSSVAGLKDSGTIVHAGLHNGWPYDNPDWKKVISFSAGATHTVGLKKDGTVIAVGNNQNGQCNVSGFTNIKLP